MDFIEVIKGEEELDVVPLRELHPNTQREQVQVYS